MSKTLRVSLANNCRTQRLFLVGLVIVLISPTLATAEVIYEDTFEGLLSPNWVSDWGQWASQGYDGTNDPAPPPVSTPVTPGSSIFGCNPNNHYDSCGPLDPPTLAGAFPAVRPLDAPGKITTGIPGWVTLRADPINVLDPPGCDPEFDECGPCDPATQECYERADGRLTMDGIDISNITTDFPVINGVVQGGVHMGLTARMEGVAPGPVQRAIMGNYLTAAGNQPLIYFHEFAYGDFGNRFGDLFLDSPLVSPIHMELTVEGDDVTFKIGDEDDEYEITMVQGTFTHNSVPIPVDHMRPNPDPGRWGFFSMSAINTQDWTYWDNFCFTDVGETCGVQTQPGDHDGDGDVDGNDFLGSQLLGASAISDWKGNYGVATLSGVAAVPEPSTLSLCALAAFALWPTRRQRV